MNRWLIIVGLLVVCHADVAVAASHSPTLLQRILAVFKPRPTHHYVAAHNHQAAQKVESPEAKPIQPVKPLQSAPPVEAASPVQAVPVVAKSEPVQTDQVIGGNSKGDCNGALLFSCAYG